MGSLNLDIENMNVANERNDKLEGAEETTSRFKQFRRRISIKGLKRSLSREASSPTSPPPTIEENGNIDTCATQGRLESYKKICQLGEGSYATVFKAHSVVNNQIVALKEIRLQEEEGAPFTAIREASLLKGLKHANIVLLHDIIHTKTSLTFVFEYVNTDLSTHLENHSSGLHPTNVCLFLFQLLRGLAFCHQRLILHRDLKPQNILISEIGELKLADFGLARAKSIPSKTYSHEVVTLWYRPPDVLLGSKDYSIQLDMWGVGCIFVEMITGQALFPGMKDFKDQLERIFKVLGTPTEQIWPGVSSLPHYKQACTKMHRLKSLRQSFPKLCNIPWSAELAEQLLQMDPKRRIKTGECMRHQYFRCLPSVIHELPHTTSIYNIPSVVYQPESTSN
ncbi:cyclin-dependent kinase 14-like isoform X2 [Anneissia japonica]|uniref:cyclin-dependent kinase 14-like isoform X2 n=1 Tax=Anneissia japonica TaxID=1529436 RepID=UPI00142556D2|nr:cyclin-dependent kinase 14-like isoform X2 [Anneissia japonica]